MALRPADVAAVEAALGRYQAARDQLEAGAQVGTGSNRAAALRGGQVRLFGAHARGAGADLGGQSDVPKHEVAKLDTIKALHQEVVTALGLTSAELRLFAVDGKSIGDIASELGVDLAALTARLVKARNAVIDTAVANGQLTEGAAVTLRVRSEAVAQAFLRREPGSHRP